MTIIVCGDRNWTNVESIRRVLSYFPADTVVIEGGARGADRIAAGVARSLGMHVREFPANWTGQGRAAGPVRNKRMLAEQPAQVLAFHSDIEKSKGTKHMVTIALEAGIPVFLYTE